ncbi:hypothetical protein K402DRAFT_405733 [Aulographum hederae CBS 113979]|uniref:Telomere-associated protein Rif1 N-terminal domain-containing protein n=1 Tax=Aulographum hederae CBS 113979 TaxID=1176131 RepID=A0A6G1GW21_9PEZI|nr:hypothetical protein K402DRAFT_405733 [Aulographum hederae CBS 113979]
MVFVYRPPTPPRDPPNLDQDIGEAISFLDDSFETDRVLASFAGFPKPMVDTPQNSSPPPASAESLSLPTKKQTKRVDFVPIEDITDATTPQNSKNALPFCLSASGEKSTPKSILKRTTPTTVPPATHSTSFARRSPLKRPFTSFAAMLEAVVRQLAASDRDARYDAYTVILQSMQAFDDAPDLQALRSKAGLVVDFIRRDIDSVNVETSQTDVNLAMQAMKLLVALTRDPDTAKALECNAACEMLDRFISILQDEPVSKIIANQIMSFLTLQELGPKCLTSDRTHRFIDAIGTIDKRVTGNSAAALRLRVYMHLLDQSPLSMITKFSDWIEHVFHGMLSSIPDIRREATNLGLLASVKLGGQAEISKSVIELLGKEQELVGSYGDHVVSRLKDMADYKKSQELARLVPRIWSVFIMFVRGRRHRLHTWKHFKDMFSLINICINMQDLNTRKECSFAWNRLIFTVLPSSSTTPKILDLLLTPMLTQLKASHGHRESHKKKKGYALSSYYTLLYYAFRPSASVEDVQLFWQKYVWKAVAEMVGRSPEDANLCCRLLTALFGGFPQQPWNENRAVEGEPVSLEEIPRLEPQWIRRNIGTILELVRPCILAGSWNSTSTDKGPVRTMWVALMKSLSEAGIKEITASMELRTAVAHMANFFTQLWPSSRELLGSTETRKTRFSFIVQTAFKGLGPLYFIEKMLARKADAMFEVAPTPSHRTKSYGSLQSPLLHVLELLLSEPSLGSDVRDNAAMERELVMLCWQVCNSRQQKLEVLGECAHTLVKCWSPVGANMKVSSLWQRLAELTEDTFDKHHSEPSHTLIKEFKNVERILAAGLRCCDMEHFGPAEDILRSAALVASHEIGLAGTTLALTEPLSEMLLTKQLEDQIPRELQIAFTCMLLEHEMPPTSRHAMEQGRETLGKPPVHSLKNAEFNPYNHLYATLLETLASSYSSLDASNVSFAEVLLRKIRSFLERCPLSLRIIALRKLQTGFVVWIEDGDRKVTSPTSESQRLRKAIMQLWTCATSTLHEMPHDSMVLKAFEALLSAAFNSRRKAMLNAAIEFWDSTFGSELSLDYPQSLARILHRVKSVVPELKLPGFPVACTDDEVRLPSMSPTSKADISPQSEGHSALLDSQDDPDDLDDLDVAHEETRIAAASPFRMPGHLIMSSSPYLKEPTPSRRLGSSPLRKTPKARLRHENSQIQFAAIESSPIATGRHDSQVLTERQREVAERQQANAANMFSDIKSSLARRKLSVQSFQGTDPLRSDDIERPTTPTLLPGVNAFDGLPGSSPTPASVPRRNELSVRKVRSYTPIAAETEDEDLPEVDVPSSPPKASEDMLELPDEVDTGLLEETDVVDVPATHEGAPATTESLSNVEVAVKATALLANQEEQHEVIAQDEPSDDEASSSFVGSEGPAEQLAAEFAQSQQRQEEPQHAIAGQPRRDFHTDERLILTSDATEGETFVDASQVIEHDPAVNEDPNEPQVDNNLDAAQESEQNIVVVNEDAAQPQVHVAGTLSPEKDILVGEEEVVTSEPVTHVANSFNVETSFSPKATPQPSQEGAVETPKHTQDAAETHENSQDVASKDAASSSQKARKRILTGQPRGRSKKRPRLSAPTTPTDGYATQSSVADEDDMLDCIEVATPYSMKRKKKELGRQLKNARTGSQSSRLSETMFEDDLEVPETSTSKPLSSQKRRLRSSFGEDAASLPESVESPGAKRVKSNDGTPLRRSSRIMTHVEINSSRGSVNTVRETSMSEVSSQVKNEPTATPRARQRTSIDVGEGDTAVAETAEDSDEQARPEDEDSPASQRSGTPIGRRILSPRGLLRNLKTWILDCKRTVLGAQEERELDEALFQARKEVHEAARRGQMV